MSPFAPPVPGSTTRSGSARASYDARRAAPSLVLSHLHPMADDSLDDLARAATTGDPAVLDAFFAALKGRQFNRAAHLGSLLGVEVLEVAADPAVMSMPWPPQLHRVVG